MANNPKHKENLKPFKKGEDERRNMAGKPKGVEHSSTRLKRLLELTQQMKNPITGEVEGFSVAEQMDLALIAKARKGDVQAYREIFDRLEGKAQNNIQLSSDPDNPVFFAIDARYKNTDADDS